MLFYSTPKLANNVILQTQFDNILLCQNIKNLFVNLKKNTNNLPFACKPKRQLSL